MNSFVTDADGYLLDDTSWQVEFAEQVAAHHQITLTPSHWEILLLLRTHYTEHQLSPNSRLLVKLVKHHLGADKGNSAYLMGLFTGKAALLASKIAGLPRPAHCF